MSLEFYNQLIQIVDKERALLDEQMWNLVGFAIITLLYRKKKFNGQVTLMYFTWYGFGRMFIEGLRTDSLYVGPFRISQVIGLVCFLAGATLLIIGLVMSYKGRMPAWMQVSWAGAGATNPVTEAAPADTAASVETVATEDSAKEEISEEPSAEESATEGSAAEGSAAEGSAAEKPDGQDAEDKA